MKDWKSLSHVKWECKYHIVFVSKYRHKTIYRQIREKIGGIIRDLCKQKGIELLEGHAMRDHIHLCLSIPPKFSVSVLKGQEKHRPKLVFESAPSVIGRNLRQSTIKFFQNYRQYIDFLTILSFFVLSENYDICNRLILGDLAS